MSNLSTDNIMKLLWLTENEYTDCIRWYDDYVEDDGLHFIVDCSDFFYWATADGEEVTDENIDSLINTVRICEDLLGRYRGEDGFLLWCAGIRKMRPQGAYYAALDEQLWTMFDECGPERETGLNNPHPRP